MRTTNLKQRELVLEAIHRIHSERSQFDDKGSMQIFLTGSAGCGKTYIIKLLVETYNRFSKNKNARNNAYLVCASTGKAAVAINRTTVHSLFKIGRSKQVSDINASSMGTYQQIFERVDCIIIDEISMLSCDHLYQINSRLQEVTAISELFSGFDMIFCGNLQQLPAVNGIE